MKKAIPWAVAAAFITALVIGLKSTAQELADATDRDAKQQRAGQIAQAEAMVDSAQKAFESFLVEYELGQTRMDSLYPWSRRLLEAELVLISTRWDDDLRIKASRTEAFRKHLGRMEQLHAKVAELYRAQAFGGEASNFFAAQYFVAEANLWAAGGKRLVE